MSIDAKVRSVHHNQDGSGTLNLEPRIDASGQKSCVGQSVLRYQSAPEEVTSLNGKEIWGGSDSIMLGDVEIAKRKGYTSIVFHDSETFKRACKEYRRSN